MSTFELAQESVVKLVLQFCKENNFTETIKVLQEESKIVLNTVDSKEEFINDILAGRWERVLKAVQNLKVDLKTMMLLYEQICFELLEFGENSVASELLKDKISLSFLKNEFPDRYERLEKLIEDEDVSISEVYSIVGTTQEKNRKILADQLSKEVCVVAPNRLLNLLSQAICKLENDKVITPDKKYDVFTGTVVDEEIEQDSYVSKVAKTINFGVKSYIETAKISPDGNYLATGSVDGFIEIWDPVTAKLKSDLSYQTESNLMFHKDSILSLNFSKDSKMLCSGDSSGLIKVFKVSNGKCLREFPNAHSQGVTSLTFTRDSTQIISSSFDSLVKVFGLKSGKMIKELKGHSTFVNDIALTQDSSKLLSASSDGSVGVWDIKSGELMHSIKPPQVSLINTISVNNICLHPKNQDQFFLCNKSNTIYLMTTQGQQLKTYTTDKRNQSDFIYCCVSFQGEWLYGVDEDNELTVFSIATTSVQKTINIHEKDVIGIIQHPSRSLLVSYGLDGDLHIYSA